MQTEHTFLVRLEDTGRGFGLSNQGALTMMTNLACLQGNIAGQGLMARESCHLSWMVVAWRMQVLQRPLLSETVRGVTWAQAAGKIQAKRDYLLLNGCGEVAVKATSAWLVLDEHNTRVLRMTPEIMAPYGCEPERQNFPGYVFPRETPEIEPLRTVDVQVNRAMIDCNDHVHNVAYLDIAQEALPDDLDMMAFTDLVIVYRREIRPRELVRVAYGRREEDHVIVIREADADLVHAFLLLR